MSTTDTTTSAPLPTFDASDFTTLNGGHGAGKLAASAVAPLVAAARGYATVTPANLADAVRGYRLGSMNSAAARQLKNDVGDGDAMMMPWFAAGAEDSGGRGRPVHSMLQMRPSAPVVGRDGKTRKYDMFAGSQTVLDVHPATPASWRSNPATIVLTEGLIKGDAALTGLLREAGVKDEDLADVSGSSEDAWARLRSLMEKVPASRRFLIVSFVGVGNWRQRPEWTTMPLKGRPVWVAFDADASVNANVWSQAEQLLEFLDTRKVASAELLNLSLAGAGDKDGVDDFLATGGRWGDLPAALTPLPPRPVSKDEGAPKQWRIHPGGLRAQEAVPVSEDESGGTRWVDRFPIGGRLVSEETTRHPTDTELATGRVSPYEGTVSSQVDLEVSWSDPVTDQAATARVSGPAEILSAGPKDWVRLGAEVPTSLLRHPKWPPRENTGWGWLEAMKSNRPAEVSTNTRWSRMGWVPGEDGVPYYICGSQVITASGIQADSSRIGVTDEVLSGASRFGVVSPDPGLDWREQARADLETVMEAFIYSGAWTDERMAATVLAIALRPAVPKRSSTVAYFVGPRRSGKSFSASHVMSFWQHSPGTWGGDRLPGSAKDTIASTEHSVAHSCIWVADDLAPSNDRGQASREEASVGDLIRSIHNGVGKRRMNPDMTARVVNNPLATLVVTAENEPSVSSVSDRVVTLRFGEGVLGSRATTDALDEMLKTTGEPARLAGAFIRWMLTKAESDGGWPAFRQHVQARIEQCRDYAATVIAGGEEAAGDASRHAIMASDLMVSLVLLQEMAADLGASKQIVKDLFLAGLPARVAEQVASAHDEQKQTTPGRRTIEAVSGLLQAGKAHLASVEDPDSPPVAGQNDAALSNRRLGWVRQGGEYRPMGPKIGWVLTAKDGRTPVALLDPKNAFGEAQARFPELIPYGQKERTSWQGVWDEQLVVPEHIGWRRHGSRNTVRVRAESQQLAGVPVLVDTLLDAGMADEDDGAQK